MDLLREYKESPAREARRGKFWGVFTPNTKEIQRKSGARSAPGKFEGFYLEYKGKDKDKH